MNVVCEHGHRVAPGTKFCPTCGSDIERYGMSEVDVERLRAESDRETARAASQRTRRKDAIRSIGIAALLLLTYFSFDERDREIGRFIIGVGVLFIIGLAIGAYVVSRPNKETAGSSIWVGVWFVFGLMAAGGLLRLCIGAI
jgi:hypothetical protein